MCMIIRTCQNLMITDKHLRLAMTFLCTKISEYGVIKVVGQMVTGKLTNRHCQVYYLPASGCYAVDNEHDAFSYPCITLFMDTEILCFDPSARFIKRSDYINFQYPQF